MKKLILLGLPFLSAMIFNHSYSMFKDEDNTENNTHHDVTVQPFTVDNLTTIPQYIYKNPTPYKQYKWKPDQFNQLKMAAHNATKTQIVRLSRDENERIKQAEAYDWIYALSYLEEQYTKLGKNFIDCLTLEEIQKINKHISRYTSAKPGEFRTEGMRWAKRLQTAAEYVFKQYIDDLDPEQLCIGSNFLHVKMDRQDNISYSDAVRILTFFKGNPKLVCVENIRAQDIDIGEAREWAKESYEGQEDKIHFFKWLNKRYHTFPQPHQTIDQLKEMIQQIKEKELHPIRKAALIWYSIVSAHPFYAAHKRTGRAIASIILLQNGYLPPLITKNEAETYTKAFQDSFESSNFEPFLQFVVKMIIKTQEQFKDIKLI